MYFNYIFHLNWLFVLRFKFELVKIKVLKLIVLNSINFLNGQQLVTLRSCGTHHVRVRPH